MAYKIYVAGKSMWRAQSVMDMLRENGYEITYDWLKDYSEIDQKGKAQKELDSIKKSDGLVYLWEADQESARYEAGIAMGLDKKIVVSGGPSAFFFFLPNISCVTSDEDIVGILEKIL